MVTWVKLMQGGKRMALESFLNMYRHGGKRIRDNIQKDFSNGWDAFYAPEMSADDRDRPDAFTKWLDAHMNGAWEFDPLVRRFTPVTVSPEVTRK
jgi:hypothetical protein